MSAAEVVRFNVRQRLEHAAVMVLFVALALTGFPQKFPETAWARWLNELGQMKRLGIRVPLRAFEMAGDEKEMAEYADNGMSVSDCADLLVSLAKLEN